MLNVRAVEHEGEILFLADDVAKIYGGSYADEPQEFLRSVARPLCNHVKKYTIKRLAYQEILAASPSAVADKMSLRRGKWFLNKTLVLFCLQQSKTKPAMAFRTYLIELETQADVQHKAKKTVVRSAAREKQLEEYSSWDANNRKHKASTIRSNGEIFYHVTDGEYGTQESYCALHGIGKPFANNLPDEIVTATNAVRGITSMFADKQKVTGQHAYERVIAEAAGLVSAMQANPAAMTKAVADLGLTRHPRRFRKNRVINESNK
jgi:prophage antirepressor-like protein